MLPEALAPPECRFGRGVQEDQSRWEPKDRREETGTHKGGGGGTGKERKLDSGRGEDREGPGALGWRTGEAPSLMWGGLLPVSG